MQEPTCRRDRVTFFVVLASVFVANLAYNMLTTALPSVMADFEIDAIAGQLLTTGYVYAAPRTSLLPSSSANGATPTPSSSRRAPAMPVMPRTSSWPAMWTASPQLTTSFLSTPWWSSTSRTGMRQLLLCVGGVQAPLRARCGLHRLHRYVLRAVVHRRRTPLRRRLLAVRVRDPVRGRKEKAGLAPAFLLPQLVGGGL